MCLDELTTVTAAVLSVAPRCESSLPEGEPISGPGKSQLSDT